MCVWLKIKIVDSQEMKSQQLPVGNDLYGNIKVYFLCSLRKLENSFAFADSLVKFQLEVGLC